MALPYQDLTIMDACVECGVDYLDTANYEHPDTEQNLSIKSSGQEMRLLGKKILWDFWGVDLTQGLLMYL